MAVKIGIISQKGGVGKSTLARMVAVEFTRSGWVTKIADMDISQATCTNWLKRRIISEKKPYPRVEQFSSVLEALKGEVEYNMIIFDGAPTSGALTLEIAKKSDIVFLPTGIGVDDLEPTIDLYSSLVKSKVPKDKIFVVFNGGEGGSPEMSETEEVLKVKGIKYLMPPIPSRTAYRQANDAGKAISEVPFLSLRKKTKELLKHIGKLVEGVE